MKKYIFGIFILTLLMNGSDAGQRPWRDAVRGSWKESPYAPFLPPFCGLSKDRRYKNVNWKKRYGPDMVWGNHYCDSLTKIPICRKYHGKARRECLDYMAGGFTYWIGHVKDRNFKLLPLIYTGYGDLLVEIGDIEKAVRQYRSALRKNPRYIKAYKGLSDAFTKAGMLNDARKTVEKALKIKKTRSLLKRKKKIDKLLRGKK